MIPDHYPVEWLTIAKEIKAACDYRCQVCNRQCRRPGEFYLGWQYELHIAHWWHEYSTPTAFVVAACASCHFRHDARFVWQARRRAERTRQRLRGQLVFAFH